MRLKKNVLKLQRKTIDQNLEKLRPLVETPIPRTGWIRAIRESLGMTTTQLAKRLNMPQSALLRLEQREAKGTVSLHTLERVAKALQCQMVYALVPENSLEELLDKQTKIAAQRIVGRVSHSMALEEQKVSQLESSTQADELARELKDKMDSQIWDKK